jgi:hypothetical protein
MKVLIVFCLGLALSTAGTMASHAGKNEISVSGTGFQLNGEPFPYTGVSFFNAIYNPVFNQSSRERMSWIGKFQKYGINVLRVWCQWDNKRGFVDAGPDRTMYHSDGALREERLATLKSILTDADEAGVVVMVVLFSHESYSDGVRLEPGAAASAVAAMTRELKPWRNAVFQIWNEHHDQHVLPLIKTIRAIDSKRLVTSSPGFAGWLGDPPLNAVVDFLTPHTSRQHAGRHWEIAPRELEYLLARYKKPVVDDEPARNGTAQFGGPRDSTSSYDQILQIYQVWRLGGHIVYHHDMFQTGYGSPAVPPSGIPDPEFNPYHRQVFEFIALRPRYEK